MYIHSYSYIYIYGYSLVKSLTHCFMMIIIIDIHRFIRVVHVSWKLCTFHRSCARFTRPLITFMFNCVPISKTMGATNHTFPICIFIYKHAWELYMYVYKYICVYMYVCMYIYIYVCIYICVYVLVPQFTYIVYIYIYMHVSFRMF